MKTMAPTHAEQQLTHVADRFDHWRQTRTTRAEPIPQRLLEQAMALTRYSRLHAVAAPMASRRRRGRASTAAGRSQAPGGSERRALSRARDSVEEMQTLLCHSARGSASFRVERSIAARHCQSPEVQ